MESILAIAILAHNEEKVIRRAIESALKQVPPPSLKIKIVVAANGCTDSTEAIVREYEKEYPGIVEMLSLRKKGKAAAINSFQEVLVKNETKERIRFVFFMDADCEFEQKNAVAEVVKGFEENGNLCAIGANCVPDVLYNSRGDVISRIYRAIAELDKSIDKNFISGGGYCIRFDILQKMLFPKVQLAEDLYVSAFLDGWFQRETDIKIIYGTPKTIGGEIRRRIRQEIATNNFFSFYREMKAKGTWFCIYENILGDKYRWRGDGNRKLIGKWCKLKGLENKVMILLYLFITFYAKFRGRHLAMREGKGDFWKTER